MQIPPFSSITSDQILDETLPEVQKLVDALDSDDTLTTEKVAGDKAMFGTQLAIIKLLQEIKAALVPYHGV